MVDRPKFLDDLAGVAGGALSAFAGLRDEIESLIRARLDELTRRLDLVPRAEHEAVAEMAANARTGNEELAARIMALEQRIALLEARQDFPPAAPMTGETVIV